MPRHETCCFVVQRRIARFTNFSYQLLQKETIMDLGLVGKNAIITGSSRGIGRATALEFAAEGANVAICARGQEALDSTAAELQARGVKVYAASCDVSDAASLSGFLNAANEALGGTDILVNNPSGFGMTDDEAGWEASLNTDMMATVRASWQVVPWMEQRGSGSIIHISSCSGLESGWPPAYAAVKAGLISHAKTMAAQLAEKKIRVNTVAPGSIEFEGGVWDMVKQHDRNMYDATLASIPFGRMGTAEEVAAAVVFLASPKAQWVSGAMLAVDGVQHKGIF
ncbi:MAG: 3-oxoacyl-[acyl-carrier protein] reductase [Gammaproteobacteria bacterium]|jgi:3-oxoacyl-[acyl-carrier protein] reductase